MTKPIIIIGASARAAAFSAHRAGMQPWCVDLFADADLAACFPVRKVPLDGYPQNLLGALADAPPGPVLYTGGLENHPDLIARIDRPIWGNGADVLRRVRSPSLVRNALCEAGLGTLAVRDTPPSRDDSRQWLLKPLRGSGGVGIRVYEGRERFDPRNHYLQEYLSGSFCWYGGAVYLGLPRQPAICVGASKLIRPDWLNAPPFHYCGNITYAASMYEWHRDMELNRIGEVIAREFGLVGLFGVDLVVYCKPDGKSHELLVLEVNPRYTASVEVLERAYGFPLFEYHRAVFEGSAVHWQPPQSEAVVGKAILYARATLVFPRDGPWVESLAPNSELADYADIPHAGETIPRGRPVMTIFAEGRDCLESLRQKAQALDRWLWG